MDCLKLASFAVLLACSLGHAGARAQDPPVPPAPAAAAAAATAGAATPAATAPAASAPKARRTPLKRRAVRQVIEPTPPIVTDGYRPTLVVRPPAPAPSPLAVPAPVRMNSCDGGGCTDTGGVRYNGAGPAVTGPQGQLCVKGIVNAQCF